MRRTPVVPLVITVMAILIVWESAIHIWSVPSFILPPPSAVARALWTWRVPLLVEHLPVTLLEVGLGLGVSLVAAVTIAVVMHLWQPLGRIVYPLVVGAQTIPVIAISPLFLFWFGYSLTQKVAIVVIIAFLPILVNTADGLRAADPALVNWLRSSGATRWQLLRLAEAPAALPLFFSGLKVAATAAVVGAVIGEWLGGQKGLGVYGRRAGSSLKAPELFASVIILALLGAALFLTVTWLERRFTPWNAPPKRFHDKPSREVMDIHG